MAFTIYIPHSRIFGDDESIKLYLFSFRRFTKASRYGFDFFEHPPKKEGLIVTIPSQRFLDKFTEDLKLDTWMNRGGMFPEKVRKNEKMVGEIIFKTRPVQPLPPVPQYSFTPE